MRRVLEQTAPHVQQIVIDPEGEFATLREKHDYIVCAPRGADAVANPQTAAALAHALWQARTSAILDIYELKAHERILFVRRFLEALVNAPRAVWSPALVVIDEAHIFAPQGDKAESLGAVIDLATRGRKRGLALLAATQRISKLHKDVAAELLNKAIGRTGLDVDVRRAADELGMSVREATETLRHLEPGEFFVYGPALCRGVERTKIGPVQTTHPETGKRALVAPPPPSAKVLAQLAKIEGLQREAEDEVKTVASLSTDLATVRRKLTVAEKELALASAGLQGRYEGEIEKRVQAALKARPAVAAVDTTLAKALAEIARLAAAALGATPNLPATVTMRASLRDEARVCRDDHGPARDGQRRRPARRRRAHPAGTRRTRSGGLQPRPGWRADAVLPQGWDVQHLLGRPPEKASSSKSVSVWSTRPTTESLRWEIAFRRSQRRTPTRCRCGARRCAQALSRCSRRSSLQAREAWRGPRLLIPSACRPAGARSTPTSAICDATG